MIRGIQFAIRYWRVSCYIPPFFYVLHIIALFCFMFTIGGEQIAKYITKDFTV